MGNTTSSGSAGAPAGNTSRGSGGVVSSKGGGGGSVNAKLERASKTGTLSLKDLKLQKVPAAVETLKDKLRTLDVSNNRLTELSGYLADFVALRTLICSNNSLTMLPEDIGKLKKLESLQVQHNALDSLPASISSLNSLKTLDLSHNKLSVFPSELCTLTHLDYLNLSHNQLASWPEVGVAQLPVLELNVSCNSLTNLCVELASCRRLKVLRAEENSLELQGVPRELLENSSVSLLCVDGNLFTQKDLQQVPGYDKYMGRFTETRRRAD